MGYKQRSMDEFVCESMTEFRDIIDIDNVNHPNMTRFDQELERRGSRFMPDYKWHLKSSSINAVSMIELKRIDDVYLLFI